MNGRSVGEATVTDRHNSSILFSPINFLVKALGMSAYGILDEKFDKEKVINVIKKSYCQIIRFILVLQILRIFISSTSTSQFWSAVYAGDVSGFYPRRRGYYLLSVYCFGIHSIMVVIHFYNSKKFSFDWLRNFLTLFEETSYRLGLCTPEFNFNRHRFRKIVMLLISLVIVITNVVAVLIVLVITYQDHHEIRYGLFIPWIIFGSFWSLMSTGVLVISVTYFVLICSMTKKRFKEVTLDMEYIHSSNATPSTNVAHKTAALAESLSRLQEKHFKICEMVNEANRFWSKYIFYTYTLHLPFSCYCIYELLINSFDLSTTFALIWYSLQSVLLLASISLSAAFLSNEAHRSFSALHSISLNTLSTESRLKMATFLEQLGGNRIGLSCLDLFVITNGKVSSVCAAILSSFFIIVDFNKGDDESKKIFCTL